MSDHGPGLRQLSGERITLKKYENDKSEQEFKDEWNTARSVKVDTLSWCGQTVFPKGQLSRNQIQTCIRTFGVDYLGQLENSYKLKRKGSSHWSQALGTFIGTAFYF